MNPNSMHQLSQWRNEVLSKINVGAYFPIVVIGNKIDLKAENRAKQKETDINDKWSKEIQWCRMNSYSHFETSSKENVGIEEAISKMTSLAFRASIINEKEGHRSLLGKKIDLENLYTSETKGVLKIIWGFLAGDDTNCGISFSA